MISHLKLNKIISENFKGIGMGHDDIWTWRAKICHKKTPGAFGVVGKILRSRIYFGIYFARFGLGIGEILNFM
jgi:hypothetical protein